MRDFVEQCLRVLRLTIKPTKEEYLTVSKVSFIGLFIIGFLGFIVFVVKMVITWL